MDELMKSKLCMFGAWCGIGYMLMLFSGYFLITGFLAPPFPFFPATLDANQVAEIVQHDYLRIRVGMVCLMFGAMLFGPFTAAICHYMSKLEGGPSMLTFITALSGAGNMALSFYPAIFMLTGVFRPDRDPGMIQLMNDMAWLQFIGGITIFIGVPMAIAFACFVNKDAHLPFPRWMGYFNIWYLLGTFPNQLIFFFHEGPFAWSGFFGFWLPGTLFGAWLITTFWILRKSILHDRQLIPRQAVLQ